MKFFAAMVFALLCTFKLSAQKKEYYAFVPLPALSISGDFDGDGKPDTFSQFITDSLGNRPNIAAGDGNNIASQYLREDYLNAFTLNGRPTEIDNYSGIGLYCLINLGNINKSKGDEIALMPFLTDDSNLNHCRIYSYCNNRWVQVFSFNVNEMDFIYSGAAQPVFTAIPGTLEKRNGHWRFYDFMDDSYETEEQAAQMKPLTVADCN